MVPLAAAILAAAQAVPAPLPAAEYIHFETLHTRHRVETDGRSVRTMDLAVVLRDAAAVAEFGQISVPYAEGLGDVRFERVLITKRDGRSVPVTPTIEDVNPYGINDTSVAADVRFRKMTIPGLEPGDRLSYTAVTTMKPLVPGRIFGEMQFLGLIGAPQQVFDLDLPKDADVAVDLAPRLDAQWEVLAAPEGRVVRRLSVRVPLPDFGPDGPTQDELQALAEPEVVYSNFRSWSEVAEWWWALSRDRLAPDAAIRREAAALVAGKATPREKLDALHAFVASRVRYLNVNFGIGRMQPRFAGQVLANRYGDCKDKVAILSALAAAAGIDVRPALIASRRKGLRDGAPGPQQFDHVVAVARLGPAPSDWVWLDATVDVAPPGFLVRVLRDKPALLVEPSGKGAVVRTPEKPPFPQRVTLDVKATLAADGTLRSHVRWSLRSDGELQSRHAMRVAPKDRHPDMVKAMMGAAWKDAAVTNVAHSDPAAVGEPFVIEFDVESAVAEWTTDAEWAFKVPLPEVRLPEGRKAPREGTPLANLDLDEFDSRIEIALPAGVDARAPLGITIERPFARLESSYTAGEGKITARRRLVSLREKVGVGERGTYAAFRDMVAKDGGQAFTMDAREVASAAPPSAAALLKTGQAAYARKEYDKAVAALEKAVALDPKLKDGYEALGRALRDAGRDDEALAAFSKQIELDPFHESAYAERAYLHRRHDRDAEAETDLLKQIEVAPMKPWSYETLGEMLLEQRRFGDGATYLSRATSLAPGRAKTWSDLGWAHLAASRRDEGRAAFEKAAALQPTGRVASQVAAGLHALGAAGPAAAAAERALPGLASELEAATPASLGLDDFTASNQLAFCWSLVGGAALASGNLARAEKYLAAAWTAAVLPEAGWNLGLLREKQGRAAEAARLWSAVGTFARWPKPPGFEARLAAAQKTGRFDGVDEINRLRTTALPGPAESEATAEVLLLVSPTGQVEAARNLTAKQDAAFRRVRARLLAARLPVTAPDERTVKLVQRGLLVCSRVSGCSFVRDVAGVDSLSYE